MSERIAFAILAAIVALAALYVCLVTAHRIVVGHYPGGGSAVQCKIVIVNGAQSDACQGGEIEGGR